ncbi:hypothetical protein AAVH_00259 [Aphelenchoides avenae]|nr:hypothetical protein AAVH_00259 [Aphelenchus avenae]
MLGAQALRTKQKVEQREKEKRLKEKQRNIELERARLQKLASDDAHSAFVDGSVTHRGLPQKPHQRYSLHTMSFNHHNLTPMSARETSSEKISAPPRSPSSDYGRPNLNGVSNGGGNRLMRWLGLAGGSSKKQRRMSTY